MKKLDNVFEREVHIAQIRVGNRQNFETLLNEEGLLFAKFERRELNFNPKPKTQLDVYGGLYR